MWEKNELYIDFGSDRLRIATRKSGLIIDLPTVVAVDPQAYKVVAIGDQAQELIGKDSSELKVVSPIQNSKVQKFHIAEALLRKSLEKAGVVATPGARTLVSRSPALNSVDIRALSQILQANNIDTPALVPSTKAAIAGAGFAMSSVQARMVIDIGSSSMDLGVLSMGKLLFEDTSNIGGDLIDRLIVEHFSQDFKLRISTTQARLAKEKIGSLAEQSKSDIKKFSIRGVDTASGANRLLQISYKDLQPPLDEFVRQLVTRIQKSFKTMSPELLSEVSDYGILITGGTSMLHFLPQKLISILKIPVFTSRRPAHAIIKGLQTLGQPE